MKTGQQSRMEMNAGLMNPNRAFSMIFQNADLMTELSKQKRECKRFGNFGESAE